jgi:hypothetical protein
MASSAAFSNCRLVRILPRPLRVHASFEQAYQLRGDADATHGGRGGEKGLESAKLGLSFLSAKGEIMSDTRAGASSILSFGSRDRCGGSTADGTGVRRT